MRKNPINRILEWKGLTYVAHIFVIILLLYIVYLLFENPTERTTTNWLLLLIAITTIMPLIKK